MDSITRKELHKQLWNTRITTLAENLGMKDYTLRKILRNIAYLDQGQVIGISSRMVKIH